MGGQSGGRRIPRGEELGEEPHADAAANRRRASEHRVAAKGDAMGLHVPIEDLLHRDLRHLRVPPNDIVVREVGELGRRRTTLEVVGAPIESHGDAADAAGHHVRVGGT